MERFKDTVFLKYSKKQMLWKFVRTATARRLLQMYTKFIRWSKKTLLSILLSLSGFFIQRQIVFDVKAIGNRHCRYNEGPL